MNSWRCIIKIIEKKYIFPMGRLKIYYQMELKRRFIKMDYIKKLIHKKNKS